MNTSALEGLLDGPEGERVSIVMLTVTNNAGGGQPVSLANIAEVTKLAHDYGKKLVLDIARFAENAWFIQQRQEGYADTPLTEIAKQMVVEADAVLMSAKKDGLANIGGFVAVREDEEFFHRLQARGIVFEGFPTYGGLAGRDLEAIATGLHEVLDPSYLRHRIEQVAYSVTCWGRTARRYLPPVRRGASPSISGRHADVLRSSPARAISCAGPRGSSPKAACAASRSARSWRGATRQRDNRRPLELVRLAVPRRVHVASARAGRRRRRCGFADGDLVRGLEMVSEAPVLRHFTARFRPL